MRKLFKTLLVICCLFVQIVPVFAESNSSITFTDTNSNTPHNDDIVWLASNGISTGYPDGTFRPYANVARCDMAAFLRRLAKLYSIEDASTWQATDEDYNAFTDVNDSTPHAEDILWLAHAGISEGWTEKDGTKTFRPENSIARCDMAAFITKLAKKMTTLDASTWKVTDRYWYIFKDVNSNTSHAQEVLWLAHAGITKGFNTGEYRPLSFITRCDMAAFLHRLADPSSTTSGDVTGFVTEGSKGFFIQNGSSDAVAIIEDAGILSNWDPGALESGLTVSSNLNSYNTATSLDNMKYAIELLKECNQLRKGEKKSELLVSDELMALAQTQTNMEAKVIGHIFNSKTEKWESAECAAWGYKDPYVGWYTEEKAIYYGREYCDDKGITKEKFKASNEYKNDFIEKYKDVYFGSGWDSTKAAKWCTDKFDTGWDQVGHYLIVVAGYQVTGLGWSNGSSMYGASSTQDFYSDYSGTMKTYTVDEYYTRFMKYYNSFK